MEQMHRLRCPEPEKGWQRRIYFSRRWRTTETEMPYDWREHDWNSTNVSSIQSLNQRMRQSILSLSWSNSECARAIYSAVLIHKIDGTASAFELIMPKCRMCKSNIFCRFDPQRLMTQHAFAWIRPNVHCGAAAWQSMYNASAYDLMPYELRCTVMKSYRTGFSCYYWNLKSDVTEFMSLLHLVGWNSIDNTFVNGHLA